MFNSCSLFLEGNGDTKTSRSDDIGIISPGFFMMLRDADFHEHDVSRTEDPNIVTQTSYAGQPSHLHPQSISSYKFMSLLRTMSDKHFEFPESDRKRSQRHPNKFHKHYENIKESPSYLLFSENV
jgi:hypothetical protein